MIQFGTMVRSGSWSMVLIKPISRIMIMDHMSSRDSDHAHGSWSYGPYHPKFLACGWLTVEYDTMTTFFGMRHGQIKNDFSLLLSVFFTLFIILCFDSEFNLNCLVMDHGILKSGSWWITKKLKIQRLDHGWSWECPRSLPWIMAVDHGPNHRFQIMTMVQIMIFWIMVPWVPTCEK